MPQGLKASRSRGTDGRTNGKSPHSTGLCPLPWPLPYFNKENSNSTNLKIIVKQGKETADHLMPLGDWFQLLKRMDCNMKSCFLHQITIFLPLPTGSFNMANLMNGMSPMLALATQKDSRWLTLEVCREFQRNKCSRTENECKFAHPPPQVEVQNGRVTACFDSIKVSRLEMDERVMES